jgi:hypothetical protein
MRCYFLHGGHITGVEILPPGHSDEDAIARAHTLSSKRKGPFDGFEVWDRARFVFRSRPAETLRADAPTTPTRDDGSSPKSNRAFASRRERAASHLRNRRAGEWKSYWPRSTSDLSCRPLRFAAAGVFIRREGRQRPAERIGDANDTGEQRAPPLSLYARLWEISENLHRAELSVGERADQIAEWIRLTTEVQSAQVGPNESRRADGRGHRPAGGISRRRSRAWRHTSGSAASNHHRRHRAGGTGGRSPSRTR